MKSATITGLKRKAIIGAVGTLGAAALVAIAIPAVPSAAGTNPDRGTQVTAEQAEAAAQAALAANRARFAATADDTFAVFRTIVDANGSSHVRYTRAYKGLRVVGGDIVVHLRSDGSLAGVSAGLAKPLSLTTTPQLTGGTAASAARQAFTGSILMVGTPALIVDASSGTGRLAYETVITGVAADKQTPSVLHVRTDALTGGILGVADEIKHVDGTGNSLYSGAVTISTTFTGSTYTLTDPTHGDGTTCDMNNGTSTCSTMNDADNTWGNGNNSSDQSAAADAHYGAALTYDYFKDVHGRNGIFGDGTGVSSRVHWGNNYIGAFWDGDNMTMNYGDGAANAKPLTAIDVAAHEMTHGVTQHVVPGGLIYAGESGGLNEATSDIFATMVEFSAANAVDPGDYLIGEKIDINGTGTPLRYMHDPSLDGSSFSCWSASVGGEDVHYSSGVANHFFFMLAEGSGSTAYGTSPTCGGAPAVTGIGRIAAAAIWFRALDQYFTSNTSYVNDAVPSNTARAYTLAAANALYGLCSTQYVAVQSAWTAANVAGNDGDCNDASDIVAAMTAPGTSVTSAGYAETTAGQPNGVIGSGLGGFPTSDGTFAILSTGDYTIAGLPNDSESSSTDNGGPATHGDTAFDITALKINFVVPEDMNCLRFNFKFLSEEYQEYVGSAFNDAFIAELDNSTWTTSASEIFAPNNFAFDPTGAPITINSAGLTSMTFAQALGTTYDGATPVLTASTQVSPGGHSLYLSIFDVGDHVWDSAVFLDNFAIGFAPPGSGCAAGAHAAETPGALASLAPARILDTRNGTGAPAAMVPPGGVLDVDVAGNGGVPDDGAAAVVLNMTVTEPGASGFLTVFPTGETPPLASNLNFTAGQTIPNLVTVKMGANGHVSIKNGSSGGVQVVADVAGFYLDGEATAPGSFVPLSPARLLDTRTGTGAPVGKLGASGVLELQVTGHGGVPGSGASAVVLNVTVTEPGSAGYITVFPTGGLAPLASNLNFTTGQTIPNLVIVKLGTDGKVSLKNGGFAGAHLVADVAGYYLGGEPTEPGAFVPLEPSRLLDTRAGTGAPVGKVGGSGVLDLVVAGLGGVPPTGAIAVVLNVTVTEPGSAGFITVFPTGGQPPLASNLNFTTGQTIPNLVTVQLGANGEVSFLNGASTGAHLVADIAGYYLAW